MRRNHLYIHAFIAATLLTTACGKKKDPENQGSAPAAQTKPSSPAPTVSTKPEDRNPAPPIKTPDKELRVSRKRSADGVREILTAIADRSSNEEQKKKDREFSKAIKSISMNIDDNKTVTLVVERVYEGENKEVPKNSTLTGVLSTKGEAELTGSLSGRFTCISSDGSCETAIAEIKTGGENANITARVILRKSDFELRAKFPKQDGNSPEMIAWVNAITKTVYHSDDENAFHSKVMESFEVINGNSGASIKMSRRDGEIVVLKMATDQIEDKKELGVPVDTTVKVADNSGLKLNLTNSIDAARMKQNDGDGKLTVLVVLKENAKGDKESFKLFFKRKSSPVAHDLIR